jgi:Integral membrane protein TerC family
VDLLLNPEVWVAFLTLLALEIVLGIDNIVFISILVDKLPEHSREQANLSYGRQEVRERSLCNRRPGSLAALETTRLLLGVKQVGSSLARLSGPG